MSEQDTEDIEEKQEAQDINDSSKGDSNESSENSDAKSEGTDAAKEPKKVKIRKPLDDQILESLFFLSGRPITVTRIAMEFNWEPKEVRAMVKDLAKKLKKIKAELQLLEVQRDRWVLHFPLNSYPPEFKGILETSLIEYPKMTVHDTQIKKVLTAVAFHQPVSKQKLWRVLSPSEKKKEESDFTIVKLEEYLNVLTKEGLVRSNLKGSIQYKTTKAFSEEFGFDPVKANLKRQLVRRMEKVAKSKKKK